MRLSTLITPGGTSMVLTVVSLLTLGKRVDIMSTHENHQANTHQGILDAIPLRYEAIPKTYHRLLAMHPLRPIHNDVELEHATGIIDILAGHDLNADQADYLDVLSILVEAYENAHDPLADPAICGLDALRALLDEHGMRAADLARLLGVHRSMGAKLLKGARALTSQHLQILSERFKVSADLFLDRRNTRAL